MDTKEPSVADAYERAQVALMEDLHKLEAATEPSAGQNLPELRALLDATQTYLAEHFRFEEESGYMALIEQEAPRLEHAIQRLAEEHVVLARALAALIARAQTLTSVDDVFRQEVRHWVRHVCEHELRENDLVEDALLLDTGVSD
jgi:hemerythrin